MFAPISMTFTRRDATRSISRRTAGSNASSQRILPATRKIVTQGLYPGRTHTLEDPISTAALDVERNEVFPWDGHLMVKSAYRRKSPVLGLDFVGVLKKNIPNRVSAYGTATTAIPSKTPAHHSSFLVT